MEWGDVYDCCIECNYMLRELLQKTKFNNKKETTKMKKFKINMIISAILVVAISSALFALPIFAESMEYRHVNKQTNITHTQGAYLLSIYSTDGSTKREGGCYASINTNSPSIFTKSMSVYTFNHDCDIIEENGCISFSGITSGNYDGTISWDNRGTLSDSDYAEYLDATFTVYHYINSYTIDSWTEYLTYTYSVNKGIGEWTLDS